MSDGISNNNFSNNSSGMQNVQFGAGSRITVNESADLAGSAEGAAALRELIAVARDLRSRVSTADREDIDASLEVVRDSDAEPGGVRRALRNLEAIAQAAGNVGLPVLNAALAVKQLLGA